jgi:polyisoprenoid-binding protein YceI
MRVSSRKSLFAGACVLAGSGLFLVVHAAPAQSQEEQAAPGEVVLVLDPAQSKVHFTVDSTLHTVHGTFALKSGTVHFNPESGKASGEVIVDAASGASGNGSRDDKMHKKVLETPKYPEAMFRAELVEGTVARTGSSDVKLHGVIQVHGSEHEIVVPVHAELTADHWKGKAAFDVPYIQWGMKDPSNFLLRVKPVVHVELEMEGTAKNAGCCSVH